MKIKDIIARLSKQDPERDVQSVAVEEHNLVFDRVGQIVLPYAINKKQQEKLDAFMESRKKLYSGAIGGRYTTLITSTSLGMIYQIHDVMMDEVCDLTEYDLW